MVIDDLAKKIVDFLKTANIQTILAIIVVIFIFGLLLLSFTFILPILVFTAAVAIIGAIVYFVYKLLGGS